MSVDRLPPNDLDAEMALLGAIMVDATLIDDVTPIVGTGEAFYTPAHRVIYDTLVALHERGEPMDLLVATEAFQRAGKLREIGGQEYLVGLAESFAECANAPRYAQIVRDKHRLRQLISLGSKLQGAAYQYNADADKLSRRTAETLDAIAECKCRKADTDVVDHVNALREHLADPGARFVPTCCGPIDLELGGLERGALTIVAALSRIGKTALVLSWAVDIARASDGAPVLFLSLEMPRLAIAARVVSQLSGESAYKLRTGLVSPEGRNCAINETTRLMQRGRLFVLDDVCHSRDIIATTRSYVRRHHVGVVCVDYLQLVEPTERAETRNLALAGITRDLKRLAIETDTAVVAASQLSREPAKAGRRPMLSDLRDSGAIEQDADVVLALHRDPTQSDSGPQDTELNILKNRNGPTPSFRLAFHKSTMRFTPADVQCVGGADCANA